MKIRSIKVTQGPNQLFMFTASAKELWGLLEINKKSDDKEDGYQRALSLSRAQDIKRYILKGNAVAPAIVIALDSDKARYNDTTQEIEIDNTDKAGWVIDGQHRLRGAELACSETDVELPVVAFIGLDLEKQIQQFVTINREAKGVPTSLYYDLLKMLPPKSSTADIAKEKAAGIADRLRKDSNSIFYDRIVVVTSPKQGQISLTNFVRKVAPLLTDGKGSFSAYTHQEMTQIIENYFNALKITFPDEFSPSSMRFFKTLGFGAMINSLHTVFTITIKNEKAFRVSDCVKALSKASDFNFGDWNSVGTGSSAEIQAGKDFESHFRTKVQDDSESTLLRLQ